MFCNSSTTICSSVLSYLKVSAQCCHTSICVDNITTTYYASYWFSRQIKQREEHCTGLLCLCKLINIILRSRKPIICVCFFFSLSATLRTTFKGKKLLYLHFTKKTKIFASKYSFFQLPRYHEMWICIQITIGEKKKVFDSLKHK